MSVFTHFVTTIAFLQIAIVSSVPRAPLFQTKIKDARQSEAFSALLKTILDVNKNRYDTMKKLTQIQEFPPYAPRSVKRGNKALRTGSDMSTDSDEDESPEIQAFLVFPEVPQRQFLLRSSPPTSEDLNTELEPYKSNRTSSTNSAYFEVERRENLRMKDAVNNLKENLRSCSSQLTKRCKKACKSAMRTACDTYYCKKKLKRVLTKECKRSCKAEFKRDNYDYGDDDDGDW